MAGLSVESRNLIAREGLDKINAYLENSSVKEGDRKHPVPEKDFRLTSETLGTRIKYDEGMKNFITFSKTLLPIISDLGMFRRFVFSLSKFVFTLLGDEKKSTGFAQAKAVRNAIGSLNIEKICKDARSASAPSTLGVREEPLLKKEEQQRLVRSGSFQSSYGTAKEPKPAILPKNRLPLPGEKFIEGGVWAKTPTPASPNHKIDGNDGWDGGRIPMPGADVPCPKFKFPTILKGLHGSPVVDLNR